MTSLTPSLDLDELLRRERRQSTRGARAGTHRGYFGRFAAFQ